VQKEAKKCPVGRVAWRSNFSSNADSDVGGHGVDGHNGLRGVCRVEARSAAPKNLELPGVAAASQEIKAPTMEEIVACSTRFVPEACRADFAAGLQKLYKQ
jgi:hypothetical protein